MRSGNGNKRDPQVTVELAAVDAALAGELIEPEFMQLGELALTLRAERPRPRAEFVHELDLLATDGFPRSRKTIDESSPRPAGLRLRLQRARARRPRALPLAFGTAASVFLVTAAVISSGVLSGDEQRAHTRVTPSGRPAEPPAAATVPSDSSKAPSAAPSPSLPSSRFVPQPRRGIGVAPRIHNRKVERAGSLTLAPPSDKVEDVADDVIRVTDRYGGFVLRSSVAGGDAGSAGGRLDLRIPSDRVQAAIRDLSALAHVRSRTQNTEDVTGRFLSRRSRLIEAIAERQALLRQLARADTPNETASIRVRLRLTNREIAARRASLHALQDRISYAAISVELVPDDSQTRSGGSTLGDALDHARDILGTSLAVLLISLALLVPLSLVALASWATARQLVRRRRERVLDDAP